MCIVDKNGNCLGDVNSIDKGVVVRVTGEFDREAMKKCWRLMQPVSIEGDIYTIMGLPISDGTDWLLVDRGVRIGEC